MNFNRSSNPLLGESLFSKASAHSGTGTMTLNGVINKSVIMLLLMVVTGSYTFKLVYAGGSATPFLFGGLIVALIAALVGTFNPKASQYAAPIYALAKGLALGAITAYYSGLYNGIVLQAVVLTIGVFFFMLFMYRTGVIKPTRKFMMGVAAATGGVFILYLVNMIASLFGFNLPLFEPNLLGIGISLVIVVIAALNLILDFKFIEDRLAMGAPKYMEWYSSLGLMITLVWLYLELLRLLALLAASRD